MSTEPNQQEKPRPETTVHAEMAEQLRALAARAAECNAPLPQGLTELDRLALEAVRLRARVRAAHLHGCSTGYATAAQLAGWLTEAELTAHLEALDRRFKG